MVRTIASGSGSRNDRVMSSRELFEMVPNPNKFSH